MVEYVVAYRAQTGVILPLTESTVVREYAYDDLARLRADEETAGGDPSNLFVAFRHRPYWMPDPANPTGEAD